MSAKTMRQMWCETPAKLNCASAPFLRWAKPGVGQNRLYRHLPLDVRAFSGKSSSVKFPRVLGHETSGYVAEVGKNVKDLQIGQRVVCDFIVKCGICPACRRGLLNRCQQPLTSSLVAATAITSACPGQISIPCSQPPASKPPPSWSRWPVWCAARTCSISTPARWNW